MEPPPGFSHKRGNHKTRSPSPTRKTVTSPFATAAGEMPKPSPRGPVVAYPATGIDHYKPCNNNNNNNNTNRGRLYVNNDDKPCSTSSSTKNKKSRGRRYIDQYNNYPVVTAPSSRPWTPDSPFKDYIPPTPAQEASGRFCPAAQQQNPSHTAAPDAPRKVVYYEPLVPDAKLHTLDDLCDAVANRFLAYQTTIRNHGLSSLCMKVCGNPGRGISCAA
jgi:hypothetical protein